jgi:hypothetical protein
MDNDEAQVLQRVLRQRGTRRAGMDVVVTQILSYGLLHRTKAGGF